MRCHTRRFSSSLKNTQFETSNAVRPQPMHTSSKRVEQMPIQGLSGRSCSVDDISFCESRLRVVEIYNCFYFTQLAILTSCAVNSFSIFLADSSLSWPCSSKAL